MTLMGYPHTAADCDQRHDLVRDFGHTTHDGRDAPRPTITVLCGSTRFGQAFRDTNLRLTLAGHIVLTIGCDTKSDDELASAGVVFNQALKDRLDELHKRKIDLADEVLVLNVASDEHPGGYIGESTRSEIEYAEKLGKPIRYLVQPGTVSSAPEERGTHRPERGSDVEAWIRWTRDDHPASSEAWHALDNLLDDYREHCDTGTPLGEQVAGPHEEEAPSPVAGTAELEPDYMCDYREHWAAIVERPDGTLDRDQVARELADYSVVMDQASRVYDELTGGRLSKPNTAAHHVISAANDRAAADHAADLLDALYDRMATDDDRAVLVEYATGQHAEAWTDYRRLTENRARLAQQRAEHNKRVMGTSSTDSA